MSSYDWIVAGGGFTGSALAYELSQKGLKVLLLEKDPHYRNATFYSYGGLAYWSGTTDLTRQLGKLGIELHRQLAAELEGDTGFRELDLLLYVEPDENPATVAQNFSNFTQQPDILDSKEASEIEPLLNPDGISGVLRFPHGQIDANSTAMAYQKALLRNGGEIEYQEVTGLLREGDKVTGVLTKNDSFCAANTVICAGGLSRALLQKEEISIPLYFTHAQVIRTQPARDLKLNTIVMPAKQQRFALEGSAEGVDWDNLSNEVAKSILDPGAVQLQDGSFYLGQVSAIATNPHYQLNNKAAEAQIRSALEPVLPDLAKLPGTCHQCLVAFNTKSIALVGNLKNIEGIYLFNGFTSTIVFAPPLAKEFANWATGDKNTLIKQLI